MRTLRTLHLPVVPLLALFTFWPWGPYGALFSLMALVPGEPRLPLDTHSTGRSHVSHGSSGPLLPNKTWRSGLAHRARLPEVTLMTFGTLGPLFAFLPEYARLPFWTSEAVESRMSRRALLSF